MTEPSFERVLRDADARWSDESPSPRVERALRARLRMREAPPRPRRIGWALAMAAATAALVIALWPTSSEVVEVARWEGFSTVDPCPSFAAETRGETVVATAGGCTLREPEAGMRLEVTSPAAFRRVAHGVAVERGRITFNVEPRPERRRVAVSGGVIEILGTRFTVVEHGDHGSVRLDHGSIQFVASGHAPVLLQPGDTLHWPLPDGELTGPHEVATPPEPSEDPVADGPAPSASAPREDLRARVARLRAQGRFEEAAELLRRLDAVAGDDRERLSYERGALLTYRLEDRTAACAHWRAHRAQFPDGAYAVEVQRAMASLSCD